MAMHEPHPGVVGDELDDRPAVHRHGDGVPLGRVGVVELLDVLLGVEVAEPFGEDEEVVAVDVDGVVLWRDDAGVLQHELHDGAEPERVQLGRRHRLPQRLADVLGRVVELHRRVRREVGGEHAGDLVVVRVQERVLLGEHEGDVVHAGREAGVVVGTRAELPRLAVEQAEPDGEEEVLVDVLVHLDPFFGAPDPGSEGGGGGRVVEGREGRERGLDLGPEVGGAAAVVLDDGRGGGVVEAHVLAGHVGARGDVVPGGRLVHGHEHVRGLARRDHEHRGGEGLGVGRVRGHHRHLVLRDRHEQLVVECRVDEPQQRRLAGLHRDGRRLCARHALRNIKELS
ncbi:unnamed protein product [Urochloa decumbens]|uniref:Uncharacterized protein n=1 Tax=Urochloa decumbens TaxID=240449 RepID=A0ABC8YMS1_9POAL